MKVALYVRVSTTEQTTLNQELILKEYCERNGFEIFKIFKDEGISGSTTSRKGLDFMLKEMRQKNFEGIVVWKLDRLGRSAQHLLQILEELKNKEIRLICTDMNVDTGTPQGKFFFTIIGAFAELEREMIRERVFAGLERAKKEGKQLGRRKGSRDKGKRRKGGYFKRWEGERKAGWHKKTPPQ